MNKERKIIDSFSGRYEFLSNFAEIPVKYDGKICRTAESAFQMMKTKDAEIRTKISKASASEAKRMGRKVELRENWESIKDQIMYEVVLSKFSQFKDIRDKLLDTEDALLIEGNTWNDTYWGVCNGVGKNKLGIILMKVRDELKAQEIDY